jgi:putative endopeptidase
VNAFVVPDRHYFTVLNSLLTETPLEDWKSYLTWQLLRVYSPYLPKPFTDEDFAFFGRIELGNEQPLARAAQAIVEVEQPFSEILGRLYVERYFSAAAKERVTAMAEAIRGEFRRSIQNLDWMSSPTKQRALDKLEKITIKVGYPDTWRTYDDIEITAADLIGNLMRISEASYRRSVATIGKPVDRVAWQTPAYETSAYYYRVMNELAIPAGYLLPPWFDLNAESAMNYGGIGTVIGHEMGHAFDNQGSQYDGDGNLDEWWTEEDHARFVERTERLDAQYSQYSPAPDQFVDGRLTLSENIGDLTGVTMAYRAFKTATRDAPPPTIDGFTGDQRFFISFATHWRALYRSALLTLILDSDGHPPQQYRANGPLTNFGPFYDAFGVNEGDGMFSVPEDRVAIW